MKAAVVTDFGGPEKVEIRDLPRPDPGAGEVLVRQRASSLNPLDWKLRRGRLRFVMRVRVPAVLGFDVAGTVEAVGSGVTRFAPGDEVFGGSWGGAHAEFVAVPEGFLARKAGCLSFEESAAGAGSSLTALVALRDVAHVGPEQHVLVNGGTGGVGSAAVRISRALGARVTATGGPGSGDFLRELGAERALDYTGDDFAAGNDRYDVIFDAANASTFWRAARVLSPKGIYVTTMPGPGPFLAALGARLAGLFGYRKRCGWVIVKPGTAGLESLAKLAGEAKVRPAIDSIFPLERIREAHERLESGHPRGKVVVAIG